MEASLNISPLIARAVSEQFTPANIKKTQKFYYALLNQKGKTPVTVTLDKDFHIDVIQELFSRFRDGVYTSNND